MRKQLLHSLKGQEAFKKGHGELDVTLISSQDFTETVIAYFMPMFLF